MKYKPTQIDVVIYAEDCKQFAHDTADWSELNPYRFYATSAVDGWYESDDCARGGVYVDWAFHESDEYIDAHAAEELFGHLVNEIQNAIDENCDMQQFQALLDDYVRK